MTPDCDCVPGHRCDCWDYRPKTPIKQADIDSGKVDPWTPFGRDYVAELNRERMEAIGNDLISRVQRAMERGAIIMAVPFPADGGSVESAETLSLLERDTDTTNPYIAGTDNQPCINTRCLHWRYHHRNTGGACEVGICDCKAFV